MNIVGGVVSIEAAAPTEAAAEERPAARKPDVHPEGCEGVPTRVAASAVLAVAVLMQAPVAVVK